MFVVDDPILALITRFVIDTSEIKSEDEHFLERQVEALKRHLGGFPESEQQPKAMEWIARHAEQYRLQWQKRVVKSRAVHVRCVDCPINTQGSDTQCTIHFKWLELLTGYAADEMTAVKYVEAALQVLQEHKAELMVRTKQQAEERQQLAAYRNSRNKRL
ncbi:MAG: hypothetical protein OQL27_10695 [Sedimenticola sp.]|nr:hypothetical protein [Sedimenticola sp.]